MHSLVAGQAQALLHRAQACTHNDLQSNTPEQQEQHEDIERMMKKRNFKHSEPRVTIAGEPRVKVAKVTEEQQTADIPLTPDALLRCRVRTYKERKYVDLKQFFHEDGGQLKPSSIGIMLNAVEWEHLVEALPDLQAALGSQNTNFQVNMSQTRSASVCCDEEGPFVDVREYTWSSTTDKTCGQTREATDTGIQLGKSSLRALRHAAGIVSSLLPGCAEPPSPPKSARLYRPAFCAAPHGPSDGVNHPSTCNADCHMDDSPPVTAGCRGSHTQPHCSANENNLAFSNYGAELRAASAMHAAHARAADITSFPLGLPEQWGVVEGGYGAMQQMPGTGELGMGMMRGGHTV